MPPGALGSGCGTLEACQVGAPVFHARGLAWEGTGKPLLLVASLQGGHLERDGTKYPAAALSAQAPESG